MLWVRYSFVSVFLKTGKQRKMGRGKKGCTESTYRNQTQENCWGLSSARGKLATILSTRKRPENLIKLNRSHFFVPENRESGILTRQLRQRTQEKKSIKEITKEKSTYTNSVKTHEAS